MLKAKAERGERLGTRTPYGYRKDPDTKKLIVDEEAAAIVRRIFAMCAGGSGPSQIARILKKEQILTPTMYAYTRYGITHTCLDTAHPYNWSDSAIANLLENEIYLGSTVNMKYSTKSYKDKRRASIQERNAWSLRIPIPLSLHKKFGTLCSGYERTSAV